jgi:dihydrofolate reductase
MNRATFRSEIALVAALSKNGVIGREGKLPWHLPNDLKRFRETTVGKPVVMGRKTFESIGRILPGRTNIIITRKPEWKRLAPPQALVVHSLADALVSADRIRAEEICVIGGAEIFQAAMPFATRLYLTEVQQEVEGDVYFPRVPHDQFRLVREERLEKATLTEPDVFFRQYDRILWERSPK